MSQKCEMRVFNFAHEVRVKNRIEYPENPIEHHEFSKNFVV